MIDKTKLSSWELENYDRVCQIEEEMATEQDQQFIQNFFSKMWDHLDYKTETRPILIFSTPSQTGTDWFRLRVPLFNLWKTHGDQFYIIFTDSFQINMMKHADLIIQHRAGDLHLIMNKIEYMWPKGDFKKPIILHDVDDNEFDLPDSHPLKQMWLKAGKDQMSMKQLTAAHHITTTGRVLKRMFSKFNQFNKIDVVPNSFQWKNKQWKQYTWEEKEKLKPERAQGRPVVGWAGLTSHFPDLKKMGAVLQKVHQKSDKSPYFILSGMPQHDKMTVPGEDGKPKQIDTPKEHTYKYRILNGYEWGADKFEGYVNLVGEENVEGQDVKGLHDYGEFYDQYDINLAYLAERSSFNKAKSPIKVIEGFRKGAVSVWTQWGGYEDFYNALPYDLKEIAREHMAAETDNQFAEHILFWLDNPEYRKEVAEKFRDWVTITFDINEVNKLRADIYHKLLKRKS